MALSNDLISQFVKVVNSESEKPSETVSYGTVKVSDGATYVQLDGSTMLTPVTSTTLVSDGDRVTVMIKDHSAVVTGNLSSPSATQGTVDSAKKELNNTISEFGTIVADKVSTEQLNAVKGQITDLAAKTLTADSAIIKALQAADLTITGTIEGVNANLSGRIDAHAGKFESVDASFVDVQNTLRATEAKIGTLEATDADFRTLESDYATFQTAYAQNLQATNAKIDTLTADKANVSDLTAVEADIAALQADSATIKDLQADVADIDTLIFGTASGDTIQASFANAVIAQLGDAQIKSAMIQDISASKITAGDVITNNVRVMSEDGKLLISDETIQISDSTRVRVQIGKDASGDYSIGIWDADGNLMFSEGGITDKAIKNAIIRDDMVSDNANISASKIDINSLFEEINGSTKTIKSSKIYLDDKSQTLNVAFSALSSDVNGLSDDVSSQGTQLSVIQGKIGTKIWEQDQTIEDGITSLSTSYSELDQTVSGLSSTVSSHTSELSELGTGVNSKISDQYTSIMQESDKILWEALSKYVETGDYANFQAEVRSQLEMLPGELTAKFTEAVNRINEVDSDLQEKYNTITKYFTFDINGLHIGALDDDGNPSPYKVVIDNDRYSMTVNGTEMLYFDGDGKGYIPNLTVDTIFTLMGYEISMDESGILNCEYMGV